MDMKQPPPRGCPHHVVMAPGGRGRYGALGFQLQSNDVLDSSLMPQREEKKGGKDDDTGV